MAVGAKMTALAGEGRKIPLIAFFTLHPCKAVMRVAAIKITALTTPDENRPLRT